MSATELLHRIEIRRALPPPAERRALRESAGLSVAEVARALGVSRGTLHRWERGHYDPTIENAERYVEVVRLLRAVQGGDRP